MLFGPHLGPSPAAPPPPILTVVAAARPFPSSARVAPSHRRRRYNSSFPYRSLTNLWNPQAWWWWGPWPTPTSSAGGSPPSRSPTPTAQTTTSSRWCAPWRTPRPPSGSRYPIPLRFHFSFFCPLPLPLTHSLSLSQLEENSRLKDELMLKTRELDRFVSGSPICPFPLRLFFSTRISPYNNMEYIRIAQLTN